MCAATRLRACLPYLLHDGSDIGTKSHVSQILCHAAADNMGEQGSQTGEPGFAEQGLPLLPF